MITSPPCSPWRDGAESIPNTARTLVRTNNTVIGALALKRGEADALLCGLGGNSPRGSAYVKDIIGLAPGATDYSAVSLMITNHGAFFIADTHVRRDPTAAEIAETALLCAVHVRRFGLTPKIALVSHSDFGSDDSPSALKMRAALELIREARPISKSTAKCRPTPPCRRRCATASIPIRG